MYLLDTVAISESEKTAPDAGYADFIRGTSPDAKFISVATIAELRFGLNLMPSGRRRLAVETWIDVVDNEFSGRVLGVDELIAASWGFLRADVQKRGFSLAYNDLLIAATALHYDLTVVTRNVKDFAPTGCKVLNPWSDAV